MLLNAGACRCAAHASSKMSRNDAKLSGSMSAGTPGGYCFSQFRSQPVLLVFGPGCIAPARDASNVPSSLPPDAAHADRSDRLLGKPRIREHTDAAASDRWERPMRIWRASFLGA